MHSDGVVPRLLLLFLHGCDDADHALPVTGDAHFRPAMEVELPDLPALVLLWKKGHQTGRITLALPANRAPAACHLTLVLVTRRSLTV